MNMNMFDMNLLFFEHIYAFIFLSSSLFLSKYVIDSAQLLARDVCNGYADYLSELGLAQIAASYRSRAEEIGASTMQDTPSDM